MEVVICPANYSGAGTIGDVLPVLADEGVCAVEIALYSPPFFDHREPDQVDRLVYTLERSPIIVRSVHAPFGMQLDFSSFDNNIHDNGVDAQIEAIEVARLLGASYVVVHASDRGVNGLDHKKRLDRARGVLRELAVLAKEAGVQLAVENLPSGFLCSSPEEVIWLLESINSSSVGVCFDTGHANLNDSSDRFEEWAKALLPFSIGLHIHDNDGTYDQHRFPGLGKIDWGTFRRTYQWAECAAPAALECDLPRDRGWRSAFEEIFGR